MEKQKRVIAKKSTITKAIKEFEKIKYYPVPEFKDGNGEVIPRFKVKMASLDDQVQSRHLVEHPSRVLVRVMKQVADGEKIDAEKLKEDIYKDVHPKTLLTCFIFERCVLQPKFKIEEVIELSETHPELVNDVAAFALGVEEGEENGD
jgi:hypothetical protein